MNSKVMLWSLSLLVGGLFVYAGYEKEFIPQQFADSIASFGILPARVIMPSALAIPPFEMVAGALALSGWHRRIGLLALLLSTSAYCVAIASALMRHLPVNCGCFGTTSSLSPPLEFVRDLFLLALCVFAYLLATDAMTRAEAEV
jgi:putative oxidoreductase